MEEEYCRHSDRKRVQSCIENIQSALDEHLCELGPPRTRIA